MPLLFFLFFLLFSCSSSKPAHRERSLQLSFADEPTTLDPRLAKTLNESNACRMLFEGLMGFDQNGKLVPALAETILISDDQLTYEFHLREAFWSDGSLVCAQDFVNSWRSTLDPNFPAANAAQLFPIRGAKKAKSGELSVDFVGVRAVNSKTLVVELESPTPYFLNLCSMTAYFPIPPTGLINSEAWIGNGPYVLKNWIPQDHIVLQKNHKYWAASEISIHSIEFSFLSPDTMLQLFEAGKLDWAGSPLSYLPPESLSAVQTKKEYQKAPLLGTCFLRINTKLSKFQDIQIRRDLGAAVCRKEISEILLHGSQMPATRFVPPIMGLPNPDLIEERTQIAGYTISLIYAEEPRSRRIAQALQGQWAQKMGAYIQLEPLEQRVYYERLKKMDYELALCSWVADFDDPINFLDLFRDPLSNGNMTGWESKEYLAQLEQSTLCIGEKRLEHLAEAERILMREMPIIPIFHYQMNYLQGNEVEGMVVLPMGLIDYRWAKLKEKG